MHALQCAHIRFMVHLFHVCVVHRDSRIRSRTKWLLHYCMWVCKANMQFGPLKSVYWLFCLFAVTESTHAKCICGQSELTAHYALPLFFTGPIDIPGPRTIVHMDLTNLTANNTNYASSKLKSIRIGMGWVGECVCHFMQRMCSVIIGCLMRLLFSSMHCLAFICKCI